VTDVDDRTLIGRLFQDLTPAPEMLVDQFGQRAFAASAIKYPLMDDR